MKRIINVEGKWYNLLGLYDGKCYLCNVFDVGNNVVKEGVIWEMQPFFYQNEKWYGNVLFNWFKLVRWFRNFFTANLLVYVTDYTYIINIKL